jgi:hypothetical protein
MAGPPLAAVRAWIDVPATRVPDDQLQQVIDAETLLQARACTVGAELGPDLVQAIYRRVARELAAKNVPLGILGADSEFGPTRLTQFDAEIARLEGPSRKVVFG